MSSILGWVAAVMAMVSPSQPRPAVIHRTSISEMGERVRSERRAGPMTRMASLPCGTHRRLENGRVHFEPQTRIRQAGLVSREASVPNPLGPDPAVLEWAGSRGGLLVARVSGLPPRSRSGSSKTTIHPVQSSERWDVRRLGNACEHAGPENCRSSRCARIPHSGEDEATKRRRPNTPRIQYRLAAPKD